MSSGQADAFNEAELELCLFLLRRFAGNKLLQSSTSRPRATATDKSVKRPFLTLVKIMDEVIQVKG